jgi:hypothetical protein
MPAPLCIYEVEFDPTNAPNADDLRRALHIDNTPMDRGGGAFVIATAQDLQSLTDNLARAEYDGFEIRQIKAANVTGEVKYLSLKKKITAIVAQWKGPTDFY